MPLFPRKPKISYDSATQTPAIRSSICTGEKTVGFIDNATGRFHEVMLIKSEKDLDEFKKACGVSEIETVY